LTTDKHTKHSDPFWVPFCLGVVSDTA